LSETPDVFTVAEWTCGAADRLDPAEGIDHLLVFGEAHLHRVLKTYAAYYNGIRTHLSLGKNAPEFRRPHKLGSIVPIPIFGGLHHQYVRV
jgi:hypothetical protein